MFSDAYYIYDTVYTASIKRQITDCSNCWSNLPARVPGQWLGWRRTRPTTGQFCPLPAAILQHQQQQNTTLSIADGLESCLFKTHSVL